MTDQDQTILRMIFTKQDITILDNRLNLHTISFVLHVNEIYPHHLKQLDTFGFWIIGIYPKNKDVIELKLLKDERLN